MLSRVTWSWRARVETKCSHSIFLPCPPPQSLTWTVITWRYKYCELAGGKVRSFLRYWFFSLPSRCNSALRLLGRGKRAYVVPSKVVHAFLFWSYIWDAGRVLKFGAKNRKQRKRNLSKKSRSLFKRKVKEKLCNLPVFWLRNHNEPREILRGESSIASFWWSPIQIHGICSPE